MRVVDKSPLPSTGDKVKTLNNVPDQQCAIDADIIELLVQGSRPRAVPERAAQSMRGRALRRIGQHVQKNRANHTFTVINGNKS